ncbi:MAG: Nudix family hydrolase [Methylophilaceae bacterium]|nr:Nudix family hydrolase [Methylophilaceae bacterium]
MAEVAEVVDAAVAVIQRGDGRVLLGQRPPGKSWAGWWEFPGGKIEVGEAASHALQRELQEELGIEAVGPTPWLTRVFSYPERTVRLHFFTVRQWRGEPRGKEGQRLSWESPEAPTVGPLLPANAPVLAALRLPPHYAITHLAGMGASTFFAALERALAGGLGMIQVREKALSPSDLLDFARHVVEHARRYRARVVVNSSVELAQAAGADGVHLSSAVLMSCMRRPTGMLCGASCHDAAELAHAARLDVDYVLLGPVQATRTHPGAHPLGWQRFAALASGQPMPVYALGGLSPDDLAVAWNHGAHGIAMMRAAWQ